MSGVLKTVHPDPQTSTGLMLWRVTNSWLCAILATLTPFDLTHVPFVLGCAHLDGSLSPSHAARPRGTWRDRSHDDLTGTLRSGGQGLHRTPPPSTETTPTLPPSAKTPPVSPSPWQPST